jgi:hypothetical protein
LSDNRAEISENNFPYNRTRQSPAAAKSSAQNRLNKMKKAPLQVAKTHLCHRTNSVVKDGLEEFATGIPRDLANVTEITKNFPAAIMTAVRARLLHYPEDRSRCQVSRALT